MTEQDSSGGTIFKLPMSVSKELSASPDLENLMVVVIPFLDVKQMEEDYEIDFDANGTIGIDGPSLDTTSSSTTKYFTWALSGSAVSGKSHTLKGITQTSIADVPVGDHRNYSDVVTLPSMTSELIRVPVGLSLIHI